MGSRFLVSLIASFALIISVCASSVTRDDLSSIVNDGIGDQDKNIYISENLLCVKTPLINDLIYVYTTSGLCIDKFIKDTELFVKNVSAYPNGELIVTNGKDLTVTVIKSSSNLNMK